MKVRGTRREGVLVLHFEGGDLLDCRTTGEMKTPSLAALAGATDAVVDLSGIEFIDSAGLGFLVCLFRAVRQQGGRMALAGVRPAVRQVMRIIRLDQIFDLCESVSSAVRLLRRATPGTGSQG